MMTDLIRKLSPLRMAPNSAGLDECARMLCEELPFTVHEFQAGKSVNGWIVPKKWEVERAQIAGPGFFYDGKNHPLGVCGYSQSFSGPIKGAELKKHLYFSAVYDDALIYHCDWFYKPHIKDWGMTMPKKLLDTIKDDVEYNVDLVTTFESSSRATMKVCEYVLKGELPDSIILNAHNCHPFCCNDDLSGVAVGIEIMRRLQKQTNRRFTYRLIVAPEHFGSIFYLDKMRHHLDAPVKHFKYGMFLESLGTTGPLALQLSFLGNTAIDVALLDSLAEMPEKPTIGEFRSIVGNDETCWDSAGYEIPFPSLSRVPFKEYHTSHDGPDLMNYAKLEEAVNVVLEALYMMENNATMTKKFHGLVCLSNPEYDLYKPYWDPSQPDRREISDEAKNWNGLMNALPRYFDGDCRTSEIAERWNMPFRKVHEYIKEWERKGLVTMRPAVLEKPSRYLPPNS